jgi:hypothetical protein
MIHENAYAMKKKKSKGCWRITRCTLAERAATNRSAGGSVKNSSRSRSFCSGEKVSYQL